ncbi:MAG: hypothetical protein DYG94_07420 [Leptolyngbya sp. PLA3]|nr:MAG: hypothetical protein EDM82_06565 [Cyanobacteria bacterium CYA]MCE7968559.1 hypothetical protein [Leptolyngbya sp. PL-A3]
MSSSFKTLDLFGSGPHRFSMGEQGLYVVALRAFGDPSIPGSAAFGDVELEVVVRGRLTAAGDSALWALRDAIKAQATHPSTGGTLVDHHGRSWTGMTLVAYVEADRVDRGRVVSVGYEAKFRKFVG